MSKSESVKQFSEYISNYYIIKRQLKELTAD